MAVNHAVMSRTAWIRKYTRELWLRRTEYIPPKVTAKWESRWGKKYDAALELLDSAEPSHPLKNAKLLVHLQELLSDAYMCAPDDVFDQHIADALAEEPTG
ncbi:MAG: hypothetical protein ABIG71_01895 [Candidatus Uhrbacteria bacterium]